MSTPARIRDTHSYTIDQRWSDMTQADREAWFNFHGDRARRELGDFTAAAEKWARFVKETGAHERHIFTAAEHVNDLMDTASHTLAPEVSSYLGCD